jgi:hypothetical protein
LLRVHTLIVFNNISDAKSIPRSAEQSSAHRPRRCDVGFEHVVCVRIFLTDFERDYAAFNRVYTEYFEPDRLPARTTVGVTHLARGGIVEVDLIACRP